MINRTSPMSAALNSLMQIGRKPREVHEAESDLLSFIAIGGGAALAYVLVSALAVSALPFVESWKVSAACYAAFIVPVYLLHRRHSFRSEAQHRVALPRYLAVQMLAILLASVFAYVFHGRMELPSIPAAILVTGLTSGINFLILRGWAFALARKPAVALA
jgi:putative flippase GtrA